MQYWIEGFQRDTHPEDEIYIWELIATMYKESIDILKSTSIEKKREIFSLILGKTNGLEIKDLNFKKLFPKKSIKLMLSFQVLFLHLT